jgi:hypothetical protein
VCLFYFADLAGDERISKTEDSLAERGGFEPPVPLGLTWGEFGPILALFGQNKSIRAGENLFAQGSAPLRILRSPSFARLMLGIR